MSDRIFPGKGIMFGEIQPSVPRSHIYTDGKDIMNHIAAHELTRGGALPSRHTGADRYAQALLTAGEAGGRITLAQAQQVRLELERMLTQLAVTYTFGASGSMPAETAKQLLASAAYATGLALKQAPSPDAALDKLLSVPPDELRREGTGIIDSMMRRSNERLSALRAAPVTNNRAYTDTLEHGLPLFFATYDKTYAAHECPGSIDYPLCADVSRLTGIEYISAYIDTLSTEAAFLCRWPREHIDALLRGYSPGWRDLLVNAYEHALRNALGRVLCGHDIMRLDLSEDDRTRLSERLSPLSPMRLRMTLGVPLERLELDAEGLLYARRALPCIAASVKAALDAGHPETIFITPAEASAAPAARFIDGPKMDDEQFREFTEAVRECRRTSDRLALIHRHVHSLQDFTDLLGADVLSGGDFAVLFSGLDEVTLSQLAAMLPEDSFHSTSAEREWHMALAAHLSALS